MSKKPTPADLAAQLAKAKAKAAELREQVRTTEIQAARHGVDLSKLPAKKEAKAQRLAAEQAAAAQAAREAAEAERRTPTAERIGAHLTAERAPFRQPPSVRHGYPTTSAQKIALNLLANGQLGRQADPSVDRLPVDRFLQGSAEVVSRVQPRRSPVVAQSRVIVPQQQRGRTMADLVRPWGSAPGQMSGLNRNDPRLAGRA